MIQDYIETIKSLLEKCEDIELLTIIFKLLQKSS